MLNYNNLLNIYCKPYSFVSIYPDLFLIYIILLLVTYLVIYNFFLKKKVEDININIFLTFLSFLLIIILLVDIKNINFISFQSLFINDYLSNQVKIIILVSSTLILLVSISYLRREKFYNFEYFIILLLSILGFFLIVSSYDLISMYLSIELQSLCFYILATFKQYSNFSTEAGIKYFILGAFSSGILLFGCSILYGFTGLTDFYNLELLFQSKGVPEEIKNSLILGILFISVGIFFKLGAAPFHMWVPDVYEGSPTVVTTFFAIIPKIGIIVLFFRFIVNFFNQNIYYLNQFILLSAVLSLLIGTFGAIYQIKFKRLLAYSGITHLGFFLIGITILSIESFYSTIFYIFIYMILSLGLFSILLNVRRKTNNLKIKKINEVSTLINSNFLLSVIFAIILFSIAGIPPLIGFYSKLYIFISGLKANFLFIILIFATVSVISAIYYIRLIKLLFFKSFSYRIFLYQIDYYVSIIISLVFFFNFSFLIWPSLIINYLYVLVFTIFI